MRTSETMYIRTYEYLVRGSERLLRGTGLSVWMAGEMIRLYRQRCGDKD